MFDLWAHQWRQRHCKGDVRFVRYVDDIVVSFAHRHEAKQFHAALGQRLAQFGLELNSEKTRLIEFGRFALKRRHKRKLGKLETFTFLGFTHVSRMSRKGGFQVMRQTMAKRLRAKLAEIKIELGRRRHQPVPKQGAWLRSVLLGHYQYYGVPLNARALEQFRKEVSHLWQRSLSRRSQKGYVNWTRMSRYVQRWLPVARICHPYPIERFGGMTQGRESSAVVPLAGICAGGAGQPAFLPRTLPTKKHILALHPIDFLEFRGSN